MISMLFLTTIFYVFRVINILSPIFLCVCLVAYSAALLVSLNLIGCGRWLAAILFIVFSGGVLIMFMILSSLEPNLAPSKRNTPLLLLTAMVPINMMEPKFNSIKVLELKWQYVEDWSIMFFFIIIGYYFFSFIKFLSHKKFCLQRNICP